MSPFLSRTLRALTPPLCLAAGWFAHALVAEPSSKAAPAASLPMAAQAAAAQPAQAADRAGFRWYQIESEDYHKFVTNLRGIGCPEDILRDLIVCELFCDDHQIGTKGDGPWSRILGLDPDPQLASRIASAAGEVLGYPVASSLRVPSEQPGQPVLGAQEEGTLARSQQVETTFAAQHDALWERIGTRPPAPEELEALISLESERRMELEAIYPGAALERYEAERTGQMAETKQNFADLALSDEEALALLRIRGAEADVLANDEERAQSPEYLGLHQQALRDLLGEERYESFRRLEDPKFLMLRDIAQRHGLAESTLTQAYGMISLGEGKPGASQPFEVQLRALLGEGACEEWLATGRAIGQGGLEGGGGLAVVK